MPLNQLALHGRILDQRHMVEVSPAVSVLQILEAADGLVPLLELQRLVARIVDLRRLFLDALKLGQNFCDVVSFMRI